MAQLNKADLIKILVEEYGHEKDDLKGMTNGKLKALIKEEEEDAKAFEESETLVVAKTEKIKDDDEVYVMSGNYGSLTHRSGRYNRSWRFTAFGQKDKMPYGEIKAIFNSSPDVFRKGYIIILNKDIQEEYNLVELYKNIITPDNIEHVFKKDLADLEVFVDGLPEAMKVGFVAKAREMYNERKLYDIRVVELIQRKFKISFEDNLKEID